ncbi:LuxR C-terminal-related transcriptional regulator [Pseudonocardia alni]|uniref:helix-turn-helix transcriptional regulator n=1 Tax=Pseudonocardia alni TaxID=33907 RepID=UPI00340B31CF
MMLLEGRDTVVTRLSVYRRRAATAACMVALTGPSGSGRTAVLDAVARTSDGVVLRGRAARWEQSRAGGVVAQLLGTPDEGGTAFEWAGRLAGRIGDGAGLVVVDDAHESDLLSLQALSTLVAHHPRTTVLVVLALDPARAGREHHEVLAHVEGTVRLDPLDVRSVAAIAAARGRPLTPLAAERLRRHTRGNPRHVTALIDEVDPDEWADPFLRLPPPAAVSVAVRAELDLLDEDARTLVEAVCVLGERVELHEVARLARLDDVLGPLGEASTARLVTRGGGQLGPTVGPPDPMVRAAVLDHLGPARAAELRRLAATLVEQPERCLRYLAAATTGRDPELAERLDALSGEAAADGRWSTVAGLLLDASRLTDERALRESRLTRAVDAMIGAGECLDAQALVPVVESLRETPLRNAVLGYLAIIEGKAGEAGARLSRAWELTDADADPRTAALVAQRHVLHALGRCRGTDVVEWTDRVAHRAEPGSPEAVEAAAIRGLGLAAAGDPAGAVEAYRLAADQIRHGAQHQRVTMGRGWLAVVTDDVDEARPELESATPTTQLGGSSRISLWAWGWLARARFLGGDWDGALAAVDGGRALGERTGIALTMPLIEWTATQVHSLRGESDAADRAARRSESWGTAYEIMRVPAVLARAHIAESAADYERVVRVLAPLDRPGSGGCLEEPGWWPWTDVYANALVMTGRLDEADRFLRPHESRAAERGHRSTAARLGYARGRWHGAHGDIDAATSSFETALRTLDGMALRYDRARIHFAYGQTLRRAGKRRDADTVLLVARELFDSLGATTYVARCDREVRAGGIGAGRDDRAAVDLTPQETAVAELVTRGMANREVAAELHVSTKTVQYHLTRIYAKFGVRTRAELIARHDPG